MKTIALSQIDSSHADPATAVVSLVILFDRGAPEITDFNGAVIEADINEHVAVVIVWGKVRGRFLARPLLNEGLEKFGSVPTS